MRAMRWAWTLLLALGLPGVLPAQNSVYGVQGIGFPGRSIGVRSRALGGGNAVFDPGSGLNPAAVAGFTAVAASLSMGTTFRSYTAGDSTVSGLQETRFPFVIVGSSLGATRFAFALSFGSYLERTFDVQTSGTAVIRGESLTVVDRVASDGGASDLRGALGVRVGGGFLLGGAVHLISGSSTLRIRREFSSSLYRTFAEQNQLQFGGFGASVGAVLRVSSGLQLGATARIDSRLDVTRDATVLQTVDLPRTLSGGIRLIPVRGITMATTATWRSWSDAAVDLGASVRAFDTWEVGSGVEIGGIDQGTTRIPVRLGVRYAQLPFSARATQGREWIVAAGTGVPFAGGRIALDVSLERALRDGAGAREEAWHLAVGVLVVP